MAAVTIFLTTLVWIPATEGGAAFPAASHTAFVTHPIGSWTTRDTLPALLHAEGMPHEVGW